MYRAEGRAATAPQSDRPERRARSVGRMRSMSSVGGRGSRTSERGAPPSLSVHEARNRQAGRRTRGPSAPPPRRASAGRQGGRARPSERNAESRVSWAKEEPHGRILTITAFFDSNEAAGRAVERLVEAAVSRACLRLASGRLDAEGPQEESHSPGDPALDHVLPEPERAHRSEGTSRGGTLVCNRDVPRELHETAVALLAEGGAVDIEERGWSGSGGERGRCPGS